MAQMQIAVRTWREAQNAGVHWRYVVATELASPNLTGEFSANQTNKTANSRGWRAMPSYIRTEADLDAALSALGRVDPRFDALLAKAGRPPLRRRPDGFAGLAATVVAQ